MVKVSERRKIQCFLRIHDPIESCIMIHGSYQSKSTWRTYQIVTQREQAQVFCGRTVWEGHAIFVKLLFEIVLIHMRIIPTNEYPHSFPWK